MASYLSINNYSRNGKLFVSTKVIEQIASGSVEKMAAVTKAQHKYSNIFQLNKSISCSIHEGKAEIKVNLDIKKGYNVEETCSAIQKSIAEDLISLLEQVPFKIKVRVEHIIK
ncbi:MAG: Asp23/Gls24 family envelope stress response protein [Bacilli bacterium]